MKLRRTLLIACLGAAPLCAQQVEPKTEAPKAATPAGDATANGGANGGVKIDSQTFTSPSGHHYSHGNPIPQPEQKPVAYIGVLTREVPVELRTQFSLAEGFGLLVDEVLPDSPAKGAGLKLYDVLVKFEDQQLVNMEQFMSLVRAKKKGDVVQLDVITGGKETKVGVTLGDHLVAAKDPRPHHGEYARGMTASGPHFSNGDTFRGGGEQRGGFQNPGNAVQEQMERFQHELREYQQRIQEWSKSGGSVPMPQPPVLNVPGAGQQQFQGGGGRHHNGHQNQTGISIPPGTDLQRLNMQTQTATSVTQRDDSGEYTLKSEDGKKTFMVRPTHGQEQSWPINTDAERQAVPQQFRDKLRTMDSTTSGVRIEINPGAINSGAGTNAPGRPAPQGGNPPALPRVKAKTTSA